MKIKDTFTAKIVIPNKPHYVISKNDVFPNSRLVSEKLKLKILLDFEKKVFVKSSHGFKEYRAEKYVFIELIGAEEIGVQPIYYFDNYL